MKEHPLGDVYMEKASHYPDASLESSTYMDICGSLDLFDGNIDKVIAHIEATSLKRWREVVADPKRSQGARWYWQDRVQFMEKALRELEGMKQ